MARRRRNVAGDAVIVSTDTSQSPIIVRLTLVGEVRGEPTAFAPAGGKDIRPAVGVGVDGSFVLARRESGLGGERDILVQRFTAAGSPLGSEMFVATIGLEDYVPPPVGAVSPAGELLVAWNYAGRTDGLQARGRLFADAGIRGGRRTSVAATGALPRDRHERRRRHLRGAFSPSPSGSQRTGGTRPTRRLRPTRRAGFPRGLADEL